MEYLRTAKITIVKDTNKYDYEEELNLCEFNENETIEEFIQRVNKRMRELYLDEYE